MAELESSLKSTPTWAVSIVCSVLIVVALLIEHALHLLTLFFKKRKRKTLNQALYHIKAELRNLGFMSLLLTIGQQPISKICIPASFANSLLPCKNNNDQPITEEQTCQDKGKVSLVSQVGTQELQMLIFMFAVFHLFSCLATLGLAEMKMKKWKRWEEETRTVEYQLSNDPRRLKPARQTSFGKRHLKFWTNHHPLLWLACCVRQFTHSVSKADYFALRRGFLLVHFHTDANYDFHKFLKRSLDHDFMEVVRISNWSWIYAVLFILSNAEGFYNHYWSPVVPFMILVLVGMKLQVIITTMCKKSIKESVLAPGTVLVKPDSRLFWFSRPELLVHIIQFILIQNSFHLAFFTWSWYNFGFRSCFHRTTEEIVLGIGIGVLVQFLCAYVTLPLYALVSQMGSSVKESMFADHIVEGLKNWKRTAKENLTKKKKTTSIPSREPSTSRTYEETLLAFDMGIPRAHKDHREVKIRGSTPSRVRATTRISSTPPRDPPSTLTRDGTSSSSGMRMERVAQVFKYPSGRVELMEVQRVVEEIIQGGTSNTIGEFSFRLWKKEGGDLTARSRR